VCFSLSASLWPLEDAIDTDEQLNQYAAELRMSWEMEASGIDSCRSSELFNGGISLSFTCHVSREASVYGAERG
jgi:hypothetical protein